MKHDIAIAFVKKPFKFSATVKRIKLAPGNQKIKGTYLVNGYPWSYLVLLGATWSYLVLLGPALSSLVLLGPTWSYSVLLGPP